MDKAGSIFYFYVQSITMSRVLLPVTTYVQKDQLKKEYLRGLHQRRIDEKFSYIGQRQADAWINLCNSPEYDYYRNSKKLLEHCITDFVSDHKTDVNVIVFGPGNALKEKAVVNAFLEKHRVSLFFVDTSREILNIAIKNTADSEVLKEIFIADLMNFVDIEKISRDVKKRYHATNFFTLLGNTLGNYPQAMILKTIRKAMKPGDKILIDVHANPAGSIEEKASQSAKILGEYDNTTNRERILTLLSEAHIEAADGTIEVEFVNDDFFPQMEVVKKYFRFNRNKTAHYQEEDVYFAKDDRILVGYSNKYTFKSLEGKNVFTSHGLRIIKHAKDATGRYYQVLCELA